MNTSVKPKILVAIPAYNCAKQITRVLDEIDSQLLDRVEEIAVIDNGSTDNTVQAALDYKNTGRLNNKLHIYKNVDNYNLGGTHKVAFLRAESLGYTHVIILHGDNQAKSDEANLLLDYMELHPEHQTVLGSRFNKRSTLIGYDLKRILGNKVLNTLYGVVTMKNTEDLGSGLNLFALSDLDKSTYLLFADKLTFNYELLLDLIKRKVNFAYVPITWREEDQVSNARNFNIFKTALVNLFQWRLNKKVDHGNAGTKYSCVEVK
jgi:dolichol-phosphate mannosyltransferase